MNLDTPWLGLARTLPLALCALLACDPAPVVPDFDAGALDAGVQDAGGLDGGADAGATDAGDLDAGRRDAGAPDAGPFDAGEGANDSGPATVVPPDDPFFATVEVEPAATLPVLPSNGDLWPSCWSDDDRLYAANGDGTGFGPSQPWADIVVSAISGTPDDAGAMSGVRLASGDQITRLSTPGSYYRKPTGMACFQGKVCLAVQSLSTSYDNAPAATVVCSSDHGATWSEALQTPMFDQFQFTTVMFLDFGKNAADARDGYVYAYGLDENWRFSATVPSPTRLYLARVDPDFIQDRTHWEFFSGGADGGAQSWSADISQRAPVLVDESLAYTDALVPGISPMTKVAQGGVIYDAPLRRYIYTSWTEYTLELYSAPEPWGPWGKVGSIDYGVHPWTAAKNGGYATTVPSKYVSADGRTMYLQCNSWGAGVDTNHFSLRKLHLEPWLPSSPSNVRSSANLAVTGAGVTPIFRATHWGTFAIMNDGIVDAGSEDSWNGEAKALDYWGYTFTQAYRFDALEYATGDISVDGGWFETASVQVREDGGWSEVSGLAFSPDYRFDSSVAGHVLYTITFDESSGDGIRIIGKPGGAGAYTSISELGVYDR